MKSPTQLIAVLVLACASFASTSQAEDRGPFRVWIGVYEGSNFTQHVRYNIKTGEAWHRIGESWAKVSDKNPVPESVYDFHVLRGQKVEDGELKVTRIDTKTGRTWRAVGKFSESEWVEVSEN